MWSETHNEGCIDQPSPLMCQQVGSIFGPNDSCIELIAGSLSSVPKNLLHTYKKNRDVSCFQSTHWPFALEFHCCIVSPVDKRSVVASHAWNVNFGVAWANHIPLHQALIGLISRIKFHVFLDPQFAWNLSPLLLHRNKSSSSRIFLLCVAMISSILLKVSDMCIFLLCVWITCWTVVNFWIPKSMKPRSPVTSINRPKEDQLSNQKRLFAPLPTFVLMKDLSRSRYLRSFLQIHDPEASSILI